MAKTDQELAQEEVNNRQYMYGGLGLFSQFLSGQRREILRPESTQVAGLAAGPSGLEYITETIPAQYGPVEYDPSYSPVRRGLSALGDMLGEAPSFLGFRGPDEQVEAIQGVGSSLRDALFGSAEYMSEQARAAASGGEYFDPETGRTVAFDPTITMFGGNPAEGAVMGSGLRMPPLSNAQRTQLGASTLPSYQKARNVLGEGRTLDFGAGRGQGASEIGADTFEPYPREGFSPTYSSAADIPDESYENLTSLNVLNVMPRDVRDQAVADIGRVLAPGGRAVVTTRGRDVLNAKGTPGREPMSIITTADTYQKGFTQPELRDYMQAQLGEGFTIRNLPEKIGQAGVLIEKTASPTALYSGGRTGTGIAAGRSGSNILSDRSRPDFDMDTTYYHGTSSDFTEFTPSEVGDLGPGIYMTPNPEKASGYAAIRRFMRRDTNNASPNVMPLRLRKDLNFLDLQGRAIMPFDQDRIQRLRDSGYDGIRQLDESGNVTQLNIFDPQNIRSVNAEFKPGESANILYSGGRTGTGIAAGSSLGQLLQEQFPKDYDPRVIESYTSAGIDPRTYAAGSGANTRKPLISQVDRNLSTDIQIGDQRIGDVPIINLEDYEGYPFISSMSDRSAAGDVIQSINGVPVNVSRRGGMDYMFDPESGEFVWASAPDVLVGQERRSGTSVFKEPREKSILGRAIALREQTGKDPLFIPFSMAPTGVDFSQPAEVMLSHARNALDLSDLNKLDADIKEVFPGFSGINSPDGMSQVNQASGDVRKKIINIINNDYSQKGALTSGQARAALLDQAQAMSRDSTLRNVGLVDTSRMITVGDVHPIYKGGLYGEGLGRLAVPYSVYELNPQAAYLGGIRPDQLLNPPRSTGMGAGTRKLELSPLTGVITDDVLRGMEARRAQF